MSGPVFFPSFQAPIPVYDRLQEHFSSIEKPVFSSLPTTMICANIFWDSRSLVDPEQVFNEIPIYTIDGYVRETKKVIKLPNIGVFGAILSVKLGRRVRGIIKDLKVLSEPVAKNGKKPKKVFKNQVSIDMCLEDYVINVMLFKNTMKISGAKKDEDFVTTYTLIKSYLNGMKAAGINVYNEPLIMKDLRINNHNIGFSLGCNIKKDILRQCAIAENMESAYEPDGVKVTYDMGMTKSNGETRYYIFRVLHTGYVTFCGDSRDNMEDIYNKFWNFIKKYEKQIKCPSK